MKLKNTLLALGATALCGSSAFAFTHVTAPITTNTKWTVAGSPYILENVIYVENCTLDIEPGVIIRGQPRSSSLVFDPGALIITPSAKIQARGTLAQPIIFTTAAQKSGTGYTDADANNIPDRWVPANGDGNYYDATPATSPLPPLNTSYTPARKNANMWGGLVIAGTAPTNNGNQVDVNGDTILDDGFGIIEGLSGPLAVYGGNNSDHNGGVLKYVSIRHGGAELVSGKELNGLTLYSVGRKTSISYIDVYSTGDDGVEIFGGTVNIDHININYADDDGLDVDEGWSGVAQYVFVMQGLGFGDAGMELDGEDKLENNASTPIDPVGDAQIYNATVLVDTTDNVTLASTRGARARAGFAGTIGNSIIKNWGATAAGTGVAVDALVAPETADSARDQFAAGRLQFRNNTVFNFTTGYTAFSGGAISQAVTGAATGTYNGEAIPSVYYPATNNRNTLDPYAGLTKAAVFNHGLAGGIDPRPSLSAVVGAYGTTQDQVYVPATVDATLYRGAFDRTAANLWTTGWTALNTRGILKN